MKKKILVTLIISLIVTATTFAAAPFEGQKGLVRTLSAKTNGRATMDMGIAIGFAQSQDYMVNIRDTNNVLLSRDTTTARIMTNYVNLAIGMAPFLDFAFSLPIFYDKADWPVKDRDAGIGDLNISLKFVYPPPSKKRVFHQGYLLSGSVPTGSIGNKQSGYFPRYANYSSKVNDTAYTSGSFYSKEKGSIRPMLLWTFDIGDVNDVFDFKIDFNVGGDISFDTNKNNLVLFNLALEYFPVTPLQIFVDMSTQFRSKEVGWGNDPIYISPGLRVMTLAGIYITIAGDFGISTTNNYERWAPTEANNKKIRSYNYWTATAPKTGFQISLGWVGSLTKKDDDNDGLANEDDRCPNDAEDLDGFEDNDGCPDIDNDKDGVADSIDKCPLKREDKDGFEDEDGCPDLDNDKDGILDKADRCPKAAEDFDGIEDADGCPDLDNDKDGVVDSLDKCPNDPEDLDGYEDNDGCPDPDNDKDGIPDIRDKCKNKPEIINGFEDNDGCPDEVVAEKKIEEVETSSMPEYQTLRGVKFGSGSVQMTSNSYQYLQPIVDEMLKYPTLTIEIRGHTDSAGKFDANKRLSQRRAEAVKEYLLRKGVESNRVTAVGYGPSSPVADNRTATGRAQNRRIEIVRTN